MARIETIRSATLRLLIERDKFPSIRKPAPDGRTGENAMSTNASRSGTVAIPAVAAAMLYCKPNFKPARKDETQKDSSTELSPPAADQSAKAQRLAAR
jgi:hypothetical protein